LLKHTKQENIIKSIFENEKFKIIKIIETQKFKINKIIKNVKKPKKY
jgi:hypothetical protein